MLGAARCWISLVSRDSEMSSVRLLQHHLTADAGDGGVKDPSLRAR